MKPVPPPTDRSATVRRRLLRGAFAVPVVATVHSGAALASSSSLRCLGNSTTVPSVIPAGQSETTRYLRVQLGYLTKGGGNGLQILGYYVDGNSVLAYANALVPTVGVATSFISAANQYWKFDIASNSVTGSRLSATPAGSSSETYSAAGGQFAVLMFSADGKTIVGVGVTSGANAATESCWGSFK